MTIPEIDKDFLRRQLPEFAGQTADYHNKKCGYATSPIALI